MFQGSISSARGIALIQQLLILVALLLVVGVGYLLLTEKMAMQPVATPSVDAGRSPVIVEGSVSSYAVASVEPLQVSVADPSAISSGPSSAAKSLLPEAGDQPQSLPQQRLKLQPGDDALPHLNRSDRSFRSALSSLDATQALAAWLIDEELIRKLVVTIDNMAEGKIPRKHSLLLPLSSKFRVSEREGETWLDGYNYGRYSPYVGLLEAIDSQQWLELYRRYYPLMQQAYAELGYPRQAFHDRVLLALDHLLQSPVISRALALEQPSVMYVFADQELEQLSSVHKQMLRLGPVNARRVMSQLAVLRAGLARLQVK